MPLEPFKSSDPLTLGVELELQLVSPHRLRPRRREPRHARAAGAAAFSRQRRARDHRKHDRDLDRRASTATRLLAQLREIRDALVRAGDIGSTSASAAAARIRSSTGRSARSFPSRAFEEVSALYGYLAKQFTIFGQHVHVGCPSGDDALFLLHSLNRYVPHFIALSASSPFVQRKDTLFDSARLNSVFAFPLSGRAPFTLSWSEFENGYFAHMERTGIVKSMKDFYWDIRPKPEYGTIELRVCDTPLTVERAAALAGYLQALCRACSSAREAAAARGRLPRLQLQPLPGLPLRPRWCGRGSPLLRGATVAAGHPRQPDEARALARRVRSSPSARASSRRRAERLGC